MPLSPAFRAVPSLVLPEQFTTRAPKVPVGTARMPQPNNITMLATARPRLVRGAMSPKPTVVMVVIAQ
jgi:hypothetical protein